MRIRSGASHTLSSPGLVSWSSSLTSSDTTSTYRPSVSQSSRPLPPQRLPVAAACPACQIPLTLGSRSVSSCIHFSETQFYFIISASTKSAQIYCFDCVSVLFFFYLSMDSLSFGKLKNWAVTFETLKLGKGTMGGISDQVSVLQKFTD